MFYITNKLTVYFSKKWKLSSSPLTISPFWMTNSKENLIKLNILFVI